MKYHVSDVCIGCGLCAGTCPQVFEMTDDGVACAADREVPPKLSDDARQAMEGCPVGAIEEDV